MQFNKYIHTYIHTYIHAHIHAYIHTNIETVHYSSESQCHESMLRSQRRVFFAHDIPIQQTAAAAGAPAKASAWARFHAKINHAADGFCYRLGYWVAKHAKLTVLASILFVILCSAGFANFSTEASGEPRRGSRRCSS